MDYVQVGKIISKRRKQKKITKKKLAEILNVEKECITYWEKGKCLPFFDKMPQLTKILDLSVSDLMGADASLVTTNKTLKRSYLVILLGVLTVLLYNTPAYMLSLVLFFVVGTTLLFKELKNLYSNNN